MQAELRKTDFWRWSSALYPRENCLQLKDRTAVAFEKDRFAPNQSDAIIGTRKDGSIMQKEYGERFLSSVFLLLSGW